MMTTTVQDVKELEAARLLQNYKRNPVVFVRGEGTRLIDAAGRRYLDLLSGIGVASLGHAHPALTRAIADAVTVPVIASGGVGTLDHLVEGVREGGAAAVLAASIFHFGTYTIGEAKRHMANHAIPMRMN